MVSGKRRKVRIHPLLWIIIVSAPFVLWGKTMILPTFDDWTTLSSPNDDPDFMQYFMPYGPTWRPFDSFIGYVYGWIGTRWFPLLSHLLIFAGHMANTWLVYLLCANLKFGRLAQAIATIFFYMSPCVLATVLACDSLNQTYAQFWGLMAIYLYLNYHGRMKHVLWVGCIVIAVFSKENGLAWAVVPPILAYGFGLSDRRSCLRHVLMGCALAVVYGIVRVMMPLTEVYYEEYHSLFVVSLKLKAIAILICYTWLPGDYIYLIHEPSRNILLFLLTLLPTLPLMWLLFFRKPKILKNRHFITLLLCALISVSPNLLITLSMMNAYAWLGMAALMVAFLADQCENPRLLKITFVLYLLATTYTYVHHWYSTWQTSLPARYMAEEALNKTGQRVDRVYVITVEEQQRKFSSFCTLPTEAFGWGRAVWALTDFEWPTQLDDTNVSSDCTTAHIDSIATSALADGYDCVWIVREDHVDVVKP